MARAFVREGDSEMVGGRMISYCTAPLDPRSHPAYGQIYRLWIDALRAWEQVKADAAEWLMTRESYCWSFAQGRLIVFTNSSADAAQFPEWKTVCQLAYEDALEFVGEGERWTNTES